jgi:ABC-type transport system substrate-binding protein
MRGSVLRIRFVRASQHLALVPALLTALFATGCDNNPWPTTAAASNTLFTSAKDSSPRHLDPTASYWSNETPFTLSIYEPPYGYHFLKRPIEVVPKTAVAVVKPSYFDKAGQPLSDSAPAEQVAESVYNIPLKPGVMYQPHPAFAKDAQGQHLYHRMKAGDLGQRQKPADFEVQATREMVAEDFVYALKRHATTRITTPIFSTFAEYVVGLKEYGELIKKEDAELQKGLDKASLDKPFLDFRRWPLAGASAPEKHLLRIRIKGKYPQWNYWMTLPFTAPVPWEADAFYAQPGMAERELTLDTWPVGTGPYMMTEMVKERRHVMKRNPNYRGEPYPCEGAPGDKEKGLLDDCGKRTPFVDTIEFAVEKEPVPRRGKFRQGFYDVEVFERTDTGMDYLVGMQDSEDVRREYTEKGFRLNRGSDVNSYFIAFNMLDPVVGDGLTTESKAKNRKLRQALSIAIDWAEYSKVFPEYAGSEAHSPLPPGIFGSREDTPEGMNPITHRRVGDKVVRRPIEDAKRLLAEAGFPNGRDASTGKPLVLNYDFYAAPTPDTKPQMDWVVRQFAKIGVQLEIRATDNNQFQDKVRKGKYQVFWLGWNADYPDAENFLFLLTTLAGKTKYDGENTSNYSNPEYDRLFDLMKVQEDGPEKQKLIDQMVAISREDAPWTMGFYPYASAAVQHWVYNAKPAVLVRDQARYYRIDAAERVARTGSWNQRVWWPIWLILAAIGATVFVAWRTLRKRERTNARGQVLAS